MIYIAFGAGVVVGVLLTLGLLLLSGALALRGQAPKSGYERPRDSRGRSDRD